MAADEMDTFKWQLNRITRDWSELVHSYEKLDSGEKKTIHQNYPFSSDISELKNRIAKWNDTVSHL